jgi:hypothetical protein
MCIDLQELCCVVTVTKRNRLTYLLQSAYLIKILDLMNTNIYDWN